MDKKVKLWQKKQKKLGKEVITLNEVERPVQVFKNRQPEIMTVFEGLTKREYFAAMSLSGLSQAEISSDKIAKICVELSDALLEELSKK